MRKTPSKPKLPRAPLPRQTEKVHSPRKKPIPTLNQNMRDWRYDEEDVDYHD